MSSRRAPGTAPRAKRPLAGLTFCCTGVSPPEKRENVGKKVEAMGGTHCADLMTDVNFLVIGNRTTPKYEFVIRNRYDITFISPKSIDRVYESWQNGEPVERLDPGLYKLAVFHGISVCLARIDDVPRGDFVGEGKTWRASLAPHPFERTKIKEMIEKHGGIVTDSLSQKSSVVVTTRHSGQRVERAVEWGIPVVHPIWAYDSVMRGGALEYKYYILSDGNSYTEGCTVWDQVARKNNAPRGGVKRKADDKLWQELMANGGIQTSITKGADNEWEESVISTVDYESDHGAERVVSKKRKPQSLLFRGMVATPLGFSTEQTEVLSKVLKAHGGRISRKEDSSDVTHVVLSSEEGPRASSILNMTSSELRERIESGDVLLVTDWFLERSIFNKRLVLDSWGRPIPGLKPANEASVGRKLRVCISGFTGIELLHTEALIKKLGLEYCEYLTAHRDLLIVNINIFEDKSSLDRRLFTYSTKEIIKCPYSPSVSKLNTTNKIKFAKQNLVPVVSLAYIWEAMLLSSDPARPYLVLPPHNDPRWSLYSPKHSTAISRYSDRPIQSSPSLKLPSPRKKSSLQLGRITGGQSAPKLALESTPKIAPENQTESEYSQISYASDGAHRM
ncbi:hypothetical protein DICA1_B12684 [Diutina catenulata]